MTINERILDMTDRDFRDRAERILWNLALERRGWRGLLSRWHIAAEPLRNDASRLLQEAGVEYVRLDYTRLVGTDA